MTQRVVHRVGTMIACNVGGKAILITEGDFKQLAEKLMADLSELDQIAFRTAVLQNLGLLNAKERYSEWETTFRSRLVKEISSDAFTPMYLFREAEARHHLEDFLEAYRYSFGHV